MATAETSAMTAPRADNQPQGPRTPPRVPARNGCRTLTGLRTILVAAIAGPLAALPGIEAARAFEGTSTLPRPKPQSTAAYAGPAATPGEAITQLVAGQTPVPDRKPEITGAIAYADPSPAPAYTVPTPTRSPLQSEDEDAAEPLGISAPDSAGSVAQLKSALEAIDKRDVAAAFAIRNRMSPSLDRRIIDWQIIVSGDPVVPASFITEFAREAPHWPNAKLMRRRAEVAFAREKPEDAAVLAAYRSAGPITLTGKVAYARALMDTGRTSDAARIIREVWRTDTFDEGSERMILRDFGSLLRTADHDRRVEMLLYRERTSDALELSGKLGSAARAYVKARVAVIRRSKDQKKLMNAVPRSERSRAGYVFAEIQMLRRSGDDKAAVKLMLKAPTKQEALVDPDEWWIERRLESRMALDLGDARAAYAIAANHGALSPAKYAEAEFHAGWYALRFLKDARRAEPHFRNIARVGTTPITISRAQYWIGRALEAQGKKQAANAAYGQAAVFGTTYYGQLARTRLGMAQAAVPHAPKPTATDRLAFERNELVHAIRRMDKAGQFDETTLLFRTLALTLPTAGQAALLAQLAEERGTHQLALMVGKLAAGHNNDAAPLAFPTEAIPRKAKISAVEKPVVYAIARQESAFNPAAKSSAGALGLLQLMPGTAKVTARKAGMKYSKSALTSDPAYNATLGAEHLRELIDEFDGSYIMTFAAYNAGRRRVYEWIDRFGDPRSGKVDPVDWVERIPFTETRNYVQRITENLQVYRARIDGKGLNIAADLSRGKPN
ncbi:transglycosylase SLT domain-containing protein [Breoghania sp. JC706]|uniref:lytic transglycosylase domain-containing protein n=1 Tax=Breoghania sp. JC706 TaxID=3117732 RepID=UPI0030088A2E